jgi:leucyl-tRNA synthetase
VEVERDERGRTVRATLRADGGAVTPGGLEKMSKSKNNGVDPQALIDRFGADTVRLYTMFTAPPDQSLEWSDEGVEGAHRFLRRVWALAAGAGPRSPAAPGAVAVGGEAIGGVRREIHAHLRKALFDYERQQYNTVVSACMSMVNALYRLGDADSEAGRAVLHEGLGIVLRLLAPITPHICHHLWRSLGYGTDVLESGWPQVDETALEQASVEYVVQVNGKVRGKFKIGADADREAVERAALANPNARRFIGDAAVRKVIVVPNKLVNIVAA